MHGKIYKGVPCPGLRLHSTLDEPFSTQSEEAIDYQA